MHNAQCKMHNAKCENGNFWDFFGKKFGGVKNLL